MTPDELIDKQGLISHTPTYEHLRLKKVPKLV